MTFHSMKKIMPSVLAGRSFTHQLEAFQVLEHAVAAVLGLWGDERARFVTPISFADGTLKFESTSAVAMQQFRVDEVRILNEINRRCGSRRAVRLDVRSKGF